MKPDKDGVYQIVEEMPRFPGDEKALMEYLKSNLQMPEKYKGDDAEFRLAEYRTFIRFVVTFACGQSYAEMESRQDGRQTCKGLFSSSGCVQIQ